MVMVKEKGIPAVMVREGVCAYVCVMSVFLGGGFVSLVVL